MKAVLALLIAVTSLGLGCSSAPKPRLSKAEARQINWGERIGTYTYAQAVVDLGPPQLLTESNEGRTAEWILKRNPQISFGLGVGSTSYGPHVGTGVGAGTYITPPPGGEYLRLRFGKDEKLVEWSKVKY
jgi:hypothetical protein